ncbi:MAG TPA: NDP-sugar synthase, partial [Acidimicrobiales bacterium]|nr:NDP-sugar synthase [Acidimicrobiales bacterium]
PALVREGRLFALPSTAAWLDAGTPATYLEANLRYATDPDRSCRLGEGAVAKESVLGAGVTLGAQVLVNRSVVMDGAVIGEGSEVSGSIVGSGAVIGAGSTVLSLSVIGQGIEVAAGTRLRSQRVPAAP